jgi:O-antigen/teichoic acid export membrane protein
MADGDPATETVGRAGAGGGLGRHLVLGTVVQQAGQAVGLVVNLTLATVLARHLTLAEFGVYGLITSLATYVFFALGSAEAAAVLAISAATDQLARDRAYTTAVAVYSALGLVAGLLIIGGGQLLLVPFHISSALRHEAHVGILALGAATAAGFPLRLHQDLLRASQRFNLAGLAESLGWSALGASVLVLLLVVHAPLWSVAAAAGSIPAFLGVAALVVAWGARLPYRLRPGLVSRAGIRAFLRASSYLSLISASDLLITSLDRTVLAAFRSAATVGIYEGAFRLNNLIRAATGSLSVTLLPVSSRLAATGDSARERELLVRGTRYMLMAVVPPTVTLMVLSDRVLTVWLGPKFSRAGPAAVIFLIWWLLAPNCSVASALMVVESRFRLMASLAWMGAIVNLAASLALTPVFGLEGVAAGTTLGYLSEFPFYLKFVFARCPLPMGEFARHVWLPAYGTGAMLAAILLVVRHAVRLHSVPAVLSVAAAAVFLAWTIVYLLFLSPDERLMFRQLLGRPRISEQ